MKFKQFLEGKEEEKDVKEILAKLPKSHADLIKGYKMIWQKGNVLKGDSEHIGIINTGAKTVTVAAPWHYPRSFVLIHELAHLVWAKFVTEKLKKEWHKIAKNTKEKVPQNDEELFASAYANHYCKNKITIHDHPEWHKFIKKVPK